MPFNIVGLDRSQNYHTLTSIITKFIFYTTNFFAFFYEISEETLTRGLVCICKKSIIISSYYSFMPLNSVSLRLYMLMSAVLF